MHKQELNTFLRYSEDYSYIHEKIKILLKFLERSKAMGSVTWFRRL